MDVYGFEHQLNLFINNKSRQQIGHTLNIPFLSFTKHKISRNSPVIGFSGYKQVLKLLSPIYPPSD